MFLINSTHLTTSCLTEMQISPIDLSWTNERPTDRIMNCNSNVPFYRPAKQWTCVPLAAPVRPRRRKRQRKLAVSPSSFRSIAHFDNGRLNWVRRNSCLCSIYPAQGPLSREQRQQCNRNRKWCLPNIVDLSPPLLLSARSDECSAVYSIDIITGEWGRSRNRETSNMSLISNSLYLLLHIFVASIRGVDVHATTSELLNLLRLQGLNSIEFHQNYQHNQH